MLCFSLAVDDEDALSVGSASVDRRRPPIATQELVDRAARGGQLGIAESSLLFVGLEIRRQVDDLPYALQRRVSAFDNVSLGGEQFAPVVFRADNLVVRRVFYCDGQERWSVTTATGETRSLHAQSADVCEHMHNSVCFVGFVRSRCLVDLVQDVPAPDASCSSRPPRACKQASRAAALPYSSEHPAFDSRAVWSTWLRDARFARRLGESDNFDSLVHRSLMPDNQAVVDARELARAYVGNDCILRVPDARHGGSGALYAGAGVEQGALFAVLTGSWLLSEPLLPGFTYRVPPQTSGLPFAVYLDATRGSMIAFAVHVCHGANFAFEPVVFGNRVHVAARALRPIAPNTVLTVTYTDFEHLWFACRCGMCETHGRGAFAPPPRPLASEPLPAGVAPCPPLQSTLRSGGGGSGRMRPPSELGLPRLGADGCVFAKFHLALQRNSFDQVSALMAKFALPAQASSSANATHFHHMPLPSARDAAECAVSTRDALITRGVSFFSPQLMHSDATTRALCLRDKQAHPSAVATLDAINMDALRRHILLASVGLAAGCVRFSFEPDRGFCGRVHGVAVLRAGTLVAAYAGEALLERRFDSGALSRLDTSASLLALGSPATAADAVLICPLVVSNHARLFNHAPLCDANMSLRLFAQPDDELVALLYTTRDAHEGDELTWTYFRSSEQEALYRRES